MTQRLVRGTVRVGASLAAAFVLSLSSTWVPFGRMVASADPSATITPGSAVSAPNGVATAVPNITVSGSGSLAVNVYVSTGSFTLPDPSTGITYQNGTSSGTNVTLQGSQADLNTALSGLMYTGDTPGTTHIYASVVPIASGAFDPITKHIFTFDASKRTWASAKTFADAQNVGGATGYLATPITSDENDALLSLNDSGWLGGHYDGEADDYLWQDGPLNGGSIGNDDQFTNWADGEPEEFNSVAKDCTVIQNLDGVQEGPYWTSNQCSPSVAFRYGTYVEYDVSASVVQAQQEVDVSAVTHNIADCGDLQHMGDDPSTENDIFVLTADIDCHNVAFTPLMWDGDPFGGTFNGQGHSISGLNISTDNGDDAGLFGIVEGATLENVTLASGDGVHTYDNGDGWSGYAGALAGEADDSTITNVIAHLDVTSDDSEAGGLIGDLEAGINNENDVVVSGCSATGNVAGDEAVGGLIGYVGNAGVNITIEKSFATGVVTAPDSEVGGLIGDLEGWNDDGPGTTTIQNVYSWSNVDGSGSYAVGGLVGEVDTYSDDAQINLSKAYASGAVVGEDAVGGLIGSYGNQGGDGPMTLQDVFAATDSAVLGGDPAMYGYIIGDNEDSGDAGPVTGTGMYYDSSNAGFAELGDVPCGGTTDFDTGCHDTNSDGTHDSYFLNNHTNEPMASWDFSDIWVTNPGALPTFSALPPVDDDDGVTSGTEDGAPNGGDGNNDGTVDSDQATVSSFLDSQSGHYVTISAPNACDLSAVSATAETANTKQDGSYSYPAGMVNYTATCGSNGYTATMHVYFYGVTDTNLVLRKYNPTIQQYTTVPGATLSLVTVGGQQAILATYDVTDGGALDADGTANGTIVDPVGLAAAATVASGSLTDTGVNIAYVASAAALLTLAGLFTTTRGRKLHRKLYRDYSLKDQH